MAEPVSIRPLNDVALVQLHDKERVSSLIEVPDSYASPLAKATVLRVGPGRCKVKRAGKDGTVYIPTQMRPGENIVFFSAAAGTRTGSSLVVGLPDGQALVREEDILFTYEGNVKVEL